MGLNTIWKFPLSKEPKQVIGVPQGFCFLSIGLDRHDVRSIWLAVDDKALTVPLEIIKVSTGGNLPWVGDFLGTIHQDGCVWHYFTGPGHAANIKEGFHHLTRGNS